MTKFFTLAAALMALPGVVRVTEYETIRTTTPKRGAGPETEE